MRGFFCALFAGILCLESIGGFCRQGYVSEGIREQATHLFDETEEKEAGQLQEDLHLYAQAAVLLDECLKNSKIQNNSCAFVTAMMVAMADTTIDFIIREPEEVEHYCNAGFDAFWRVLANE